MKVTASGLWRAANCDASSVLPHTKSTTDQSSRGNVLHEFLARVPKMGREEALEMVPAEHRAACEVLPIDRLPIDPNAYAPEVALAFDVETGSARQLGQNMGRDYSDVKPSEVAGTIDVLGVSETRVHVLDWKSGWGELIPAQDNWQILFAALAAARTFDRTEAAGALIRLKEDGEVYFDRAEFDELDLDSFEQRLRKLMAHISSLDVRTAVPHEGPWCRYCPAIASCPAKVALLRAVAKEALDEPPDAEFTLSAETAPLVYERFKRIDQLMKKVWDALKEYARHTPIQLANGKVYGEKAHGEREVLAELAEPLLRERFGESADGVVKVKREITISALEALVRPTINGKKGPDGKRLTLKAAFEEAWMELERHGAARVVKAPRLTEYRPKEAATNDPG